MNYGVNSANSWVVHNQVLFHWIWRFSHGGTRILGNLHIDIIWYNIIYIIYWLVVSNIFPYFSRWLLHHPPAGIFQWYPNWSPVLKIPEIPSWKKTSCSGDKQKYPRMISIFWIPFDIPWSSMINHDQPLYQPWYKSLSTIISTGAHLSGISGISRPRSGYRQPGEGEEQAFMYQWGSGARGAMGAMNRGDANSAFGGAFPNSARWFRWWTKTMTEFRIENGWKWPSRNSWFTL